KGSDRGDIRRRGSWQDDDRPPRRPRGPKGGRDSGFHRRRARPGCDFRAPHRRRCRRPDHLSARQRRAGPGDHRYAGAKRRLRRHRPGLGGRSRPPGRTGRRDGRFPYGPARPPHVPGAAEADRLHQPLAHLRDVHQPAAHEDRRRLRQPGNDHGWTRSGILRLSSSRYPPGSAHQGRRRGNRQPNAGEGGEEQAGAAVPPGGVRHVFPGRAVRCFARGRPPGPGRGSRTHRQERNVVFLRGRAFGAVAGERQGFPGAESAVGG
ncbi:uncharacterized protein METZ01_LOCUS435135, partial [marine metagenome]